MEVTSLFKKWMLFGSLLAIVLMGFQGVSAYKRRQQFSAMVNEIGSVGEFRKAPVVNHSNSLLWYARNEENGLGIFQADLKTLSCRQIGLITRVDTGTDYFKLFGWSQDNQYAVLYREPEELHDTNSSLLVYDGRNGSLCESININKSIEKVIWQNPNSFLFLNVSGELFLHNLKSGIDANQSKGNKPRKIGRLGSYGTTEALSLVSNNTLAFVQKEKTGDNFWSFDLKTQESKRLSNFTNVFFEWPSCSEAGQFLFSWIEPGANRRHLFRFDPNQTSGNDFPEQVTFGGEHTFNGQWLQKGTGYAYVGNPGNVSYLAIRPKNPSDNTNLFQKGYIRSYSVSPTGDKIYALAAVGSEPQGIWEYDLKTKALRCVVPGANTPFVASDVIAPQIGFAEDKDGAKIPYYMLPPRDFEVGRKYPVIIDGPCESRWRPHSQLLANAGIYYVAVNRRGLASSDDLLGAVEDVRQVYRKLMDNPSINQKKIFIMGFSSAAAVASQLVEREPDLWRGAVLNSPVYLPKFLNNKQYPRIFISVGEVDPAVSAVRGFEQHNASSSITTVYYPSAGHMLRDVKYTRDRDRRMVEFVLDN